MALHDDDKKYTAFEAGRQLYQFNRLQFVLTNAVAAFQCLMMEFLSKQGLTSVF